MNIKINYPENRCHIKNIAFIKALLIQYSIDTLNATVEEKDQIKIKILEYLKNN